MSGQQQAHQGIPMVSVENHWLNVFNRYDVDGDGRIALSEFKTMLRSSRFNRDIPDRVVRQILMNADTDKDGYLEFNEFLKLVESDVGRSLFNSYINSYVRNVIPRRTWTRDDIIDGEYEDQYTCRPPAIGMLIISIVEMGLYLYDVAATHSTVSTDGPVSQLFIYNPRKRAEAWRFLTYMFVHIGVFHLGVNILVQVLLGIPLEMVHRWWRVLIVYFAGVIAGSLATSLSDPYVFLAGASGGVYALITAHIATIIMNWSEMQFAVWQLLVFLVLTSVDLGSSIHARYIANQDNKFLVLGLVNFLGRSEAQTIRYSKLPLIRHAWDLTHAELQNNPDYRSNLVGYVAHLGGAAAGLLVGLYVLRNLEVRSWERTVWRLSMAVFFVLITVAIVWNIAFPSYFPPQDIRVH